MRTSDEFKAEEHDKQSVMNRISNQRITILLAMDAVSYTFKSMSTSKQVIVECVAHARRGGYGGLFSYDGQEKPLQGAIGVESPMRRSHSHTKIRVKALSIEGMACSGTPREQPSLRDRDRWKASVSNREYCRSWSQSDRQAQSWEGSEITVRS